jgi:hypothetical protein
MFVGYPKETLGYYVYHSSEGNVFLKTTFLNGNLDENVYMIKHEDANFRNPFMD